MGKRRYILEDNKELLISWYSGWKLTQVYYNNEYIGELNKEQLLNHGIMDLPNGKHLELCLDKGLFTTLVSKIDGEHIPNSMGDPKYQLRQIFYILFFIGIYNFLLGYLFCFTEITNENPELQNIGIVFFVIGAFQLLSGFGTTKGSMLCLIIATLFFAADVAYSINSFQYTGLKTTIVIKLFLMLYTLKGFKYTKRINQLKK